MKVEDWPPQKIDEHLNGIIYQLGEPYWLFLLLLLSDLFGKKKKKKTGIPSNFLQHRD